MNRDNNRQSRAFIILQFLVAPVAVGLVVAFLTPVGPWVLKLIFPPAPPSPPDTEISKVVDGNNLPVINGGLTPSNSIMFIFSGKDNVEVSSYQCSIDGAQFSFCKSPYPYSPKVGIHFFSVRSIDNEGTGDPTPADYNLTIVTSATVEGVVKRVDKPVPYVDVIADKTYKDQTVEGGTFILQNVPRGNHTYEILNKTSPLYRDKFYILQEDSFKNLGTIDIAATTVIHMVSPIRALGPLAMHFGNASSPGGDGGGSFSSNISGGGRAHVGANTSTTTRLAAAWLTEEEASKLFCARYSMLCTTRSTPPSSAAPTSSAPKPVIVSPTFGILNLNGLNDAYIPEANERPGPGVGLVYNESLKEGTPYHHVAVSVIGTPQRLSEIERVTYYLHPTFKPDVITIYSPEDKFGISFNTWGQFELKGKVYFKDGQVEDVSKKIVFGSIGHDEEFNTNFPRKP